jgi:hypothetical protein
MDYLITSKVPKFNKLMGTIGLDKLKKNKNYYFD